MSGHEFVGLDGWPCGFAASATGVALMGAVRDVPGGEELDEETVEGHAWHLYSTERFGHDEELPRNRQVSVKASQTELRKLHDLAEQLADHIDKLHRPAVSALFCLGQNVWTVAAMLREMQESARVAYGELEAGDAPAGRPQKIRAGVVAREAAGVFEEIAGIRPTFTSDPDTGKVRGAWPAFLSEVFTALGIEASVDAQVKAVSQKTPTETGH